jgi:hypothetical protein
MAAFTNYYKTDRVLNLQYRHPIGAAEGRFLWLESGVKYDNDH